MFVGKEKQLKNALCSKERALEDALCRSIYELQALAIFYDQHSHPKRAQEI
jgi:hypothetical protein